MISRWAPFFVALCLLACGGEEAAPVSIAQDETRPAPQVEAPQVEAPSTESVVTGPGSMGPAPSLELHIALTDEGIEGTLRNVGSDPATVVLPGDGSDAGWREPHIRWQVRSGEQALEREDLGRCGMYAEQWWEDVVVLAPGEERDLTWLGTPFYGYDVPASGRVQVRVAYEITGEHADDVPDSDARAAALPPVTVESNAIDVPVARFRQPS